MNDVPAPASRNSPCPCGSGQRYKDCHGALDRVGSATGRRSSYRAPESEWGSLSEHERDECGALMERALSHQVAGRLEAAASDYAAVLARAPSTHDALHMSGVIELTRRNLDEAERLIVAAMALRPRYPAIEHNLLLVQDARMEALRVHQEELCERALPILVDLALAHEPHRKPPRRPDSDDTRIHLIGRLHAHDEDDGWLLRRLADMLDERKLLVWSTERLRGDRIRTLDSDAGIVPRGGTHVFVGMNVDCAPWVERAEAERVIVFCFGAPPSTCLDRLRAIALDGARPVELVFPSSALAARFGRHHVVLPPPIGLLAEMRANASDSVRRYDEWMIEEPPPFPAGIVGQNGRPVAEPDDVDFLRDIAARAGRLHVYDPGRLRFTLGRDPRVIAFARGRCGLPEFIATLACYVQRTMPWWHESLERGMLAAMAAGLPVVCPSTSIYSEYIDDGVDGLVYETREQALQHIVDLHRAPAWARALGRAAGEKARRLFGRDVLARRYVELIAGGEAAQTAARYAYASNVGVLR